VFERWTQKTPAGAEVSPAAEIVVILVVVAIALSFLSGVRLYLFLFLAVLSVLVLAEEATGEGGLHRAP